MELHATPSGESSASLSTAPTIKGKGGFRDVFDRGGRNKGTPALPNSDQVFISGRGGARKIAKSPVSPGPSNARRINALLASVITRKSDKDPSINDLELPAPPMTMHSSTTNSSKVTIKAAVKEVLGGGGNEHGMWRHQEVFHASYGRGGVVHPLRRRSTEDNASSMDSVSTGYTTPAPLSPGRTDSDSLSITRNPQGLFYFGDRTTHIANSDHDHDPQHGPRERIFHPYESEHHSESLSNAHSSTSMSMARSGASKLSAKVAVKEVLGEGGNDDGEWKYAHMFYPGYGRGGEGRRFSFHGDDAHSPTKSTFGFPPRTTSNIVLEAEPSHHQPISPQSDPEEHYRSLDLDRSSNISTGTRRPQVDEQVIEIHRERSNSEGTQVHSIELLNFRQKLKNDARKRQKALQSIEQESIETPVPHIPFRPESSSHSISAFSSVSMSERAIPPAPLTIAPDPPSSTVGSRARLNLSPLIIPHGSPLHHRAGSPWTSHRSSSPPVTPFSLPSPTPQETRIILPSTTSPTQRRRSTSAIPPSASYPPPPSEEITQGYQTPLPSPWHHPNQYHTFSPDPDPTGIPTFTDSTTPPSSGLYSVPIGSPHPLPPPNVGHLDPRLVYALALAHSQSISIRMAESTAAERFALEAERSRLLEEREKLENEKKLLSDRFRDLRKEMHIRKKTIEGLTWLVEEVSSGSGSGSGASGSRNNEDVEDWDSREDSSSEDMNESTQTESSSRPIS